MGPLIIAIIISQLFPQVQNSDPANFTQQTPWKFDFTQSPSVVSLYEDPYRIQSEGNTYRGECARNTSFCSLTSQIQIEERTPSDPQTLSLIMEVDENLSCPTPPNPGETTILLGEIKRRYNYHGYFGFNMSLPQTDTVYSLYLKIVVANIETQRYVIKPYINSIRSFYPTPNAAELPLPKEFIFSDSMNMVTKSFQIQLYYTSIVKNFTSRGWLQCLFWKKFGYFFSVLNVGHLYGGHTTDSDYDYNIDSLPLVTRIASIRYEHSYSTACHKGHETVDDTSGGIEGGTILVVIIVTSVVGGLGVVIAFVIFVVAVIFCCVKCKKSGKSSRKSSVDKLRELDENEEEQLFAKITVNPKLFTISLDDLEIKQSIGKGGFNVVYLARYKHSDVAFKAFSAKYLVDSEERFEEFEKEISIMSSLTGPNIITFFGGVCSPPRLGIVMEYCSNGNVQSFLTSNKSVKIEEKMRMVAEIACGCAILHSKNIIYRDLKPENALLDKSLTVKLTDFGLSKLMSDIQNEQTQNIGTSVFMAPEVALSETYDLKADVFSFGILVWCVFCNFNPYGKSATYNIQAKVATDENVRPDIETLHKIFSNEKSEKYSFVVKMTARCWSRDSTQRPTFDEILQEIEEGK